jgi:hypothetical protein
VTSGSSVSLKKLKSSERRSSKAVLKAVLAIWLKSKEMDLLQCMRIELKE